MTREADFPFDLKNIISDCVLALFWAKGEVIQFLSECEVQAAQLRGEVYIDVITGKSKSLQ